MQSKDKKTANNSESLPSLIRKKRETSASLSSDTSSGKLPQNLNATPAGCYGEFGVLNK